MPRFARPDATRSVSRVSTTTAVQPSTTAWPTRRVLAKVPEITALFWVVKLLTTGMGEACSDWLAGGADSGIGRLAMAGGLALVGFVVSLWLQLRADRYRPVTYWFAVAMVAVFGTMAADGVHSVLGLSYTLTTVAYVLALVVIFWLWHRVEGSIDIHSITTRRRELFYWATVLATFALGTAAGDLTAMSMDLGYLPSAGLFAVVMLAVWGAWRAGLGEVVAFWAAYVFTRPLGASIADWLGKPAEKGHGVGLGDGPVTIAATVLILALVAWLAKSRHGIQDEIACRPESCVWAGGSRWGLIRTCLECRRGTSLGFDAPIGVLLDDTARSPGRRPICAQTSMQPADWIRHETTQTPAMSWV